MKKSILVTLSFVMISYALLVNAGQSDLFGISPTETGCFVNVDYRCQDPMAGGKPFYNLISWSEKSSKAKYSLFSSKKNSNDVQNSLSSCILYAQLLKTECGIQAPVAVYFNKNSSNGPVTFVVSDEDVNLSKKSKLPQVFSDYFNDKLDQSKVIKVKVGQAGNGISLTSQGVFKSTANSSFEFGKKAIKTDCKTVNGRNQCTDQIQTDEDFTASLKDGIFQIYSPKLGPTYRVDVSSFNNTRLEFLSNWPFMQIVGDEGIAWVASNNFKNFELRSGQRLHLTSDIVFRDIFLMMQDDGNLVLRVLSTGKILWQTGSNKWCKDKFNGCSDLSYYKARFDGGKLEVSYITKSGSAKSLWHNGINEGDRLQITSTYPYLAVYSSKNAMLWPRANWLSCLGKSAGNVTCLHPEMPLYSQGDKNLLAFINKKEGTNYSIEQGWCAPTSLAMAGKAYANEKAKHFDLNKNIFSTTATDSFVDSNDPNTIIWNFMKQLNMDIAKQEVKFSWGYTYKGPGVPFSYSAFDEELKGKKIFPMVPSDKKGFSNNYDVTISVPYAFSLTYKIDNPEHSFGIDKSQAFREKLFLEKMPMGVVSSSNHMFAMNGLESSRYLKLFDPWGGIFDVDVADDGKNGFTYVKTSGEMGNNQLVKASGGTSSTYFAYSLAGYVPIKHESDFGANSAASTYYSKAEDVSSSSNNVSNKSGVLEISSDLPISDEEAKKLADLVKSDPKKAGVVVPFAVSKPMPKTTAVQPAVAVAPTPTEEPPIIITQPVGANYKQYDHIKLDVVATGGSLLYDWYKDGKLIENRLKTDSKLELIIEDNSGPIRKNCSAAFDCTGGGEFYVKVYNQKGEVFSNKIKVTCTGCYGDGPPFSITSKPVQLMKAKGSTVELKVETTGGSNLSYQWSKDGKIVNGATKSTYQFNAIEDGNFTVKVSKGDYVQTAEIANVYIISEPSISVHPYSNNFKDGETVDLKVNASGNGTLSYQWYRGETPISGATSNTYQFTFRDQAAGAYKVKVSNEGGFVFSNVANIGKSVYIPPIEIPQIISQPESVTQSSGGVVTLSVKAKENGAYLSYQWFKGSTAVSFATKSSYSFNLTPDKVGEYRVKVSNFLGEVTSNVAKVTSLSGPVISAQPVAVSKKLGESVTLSVTASGSGTLSYQWYKGNIAISNATSSSYQFTMASDKAGDYKVKVSNAAGDVTSNVATVTLLIAPTISSHPQSVSKKAGESVTLSVTASGSGTLSYQWYKGTTAISGATSSSYPFTMASDKAGDYKVKVTNVEGDVTSNVATVTLLTPPTISSHPQSVSKKAGESVTLSVTASGSGTLSYQWYKGNIAISNATSSSYQFTMASDKAGDYKVKVSNAAGDVTSNVATVTLLIAPTISSHPQSVSKKIGDSVSLDVIATGSGSLSYQWYKGSEAISNAKNSVYKFTMAKDKVGEYQVKISNEIGEVSSQVIRVDLEGTPILRKNLTLTLTGSNSVLGEYQKWSTYNTGFDLDIEAIGPNLKYQWYKDGQPYEKESATANYKSFTVVDANGQPMISAFGVYQVKVTNDSGTVYSNELNITFTELQLNVGTSNRKSTGEKVDLEGVSSGTFELKDCFWKFNGQKVQGANSKKYSFTFESSKAGTYKIECRDVFGFPIWTERWLGAK